MENYFLAVNEIVPSLNKNTASVLENLVTDVSVKLLNVTRPTSKGIDLEVNLKLVPRWERARTQDE